MTPECAQPQPVALTGKRRWFGPLAGGVSQPPWTPRAAAAAVVVSFGGIFGLPQLLGFLAPGWDEARFIWPELTIHLPMLCCLVYLTRRAGTTLEAAFGLRGARLGKVLVSAVALHILGSLLALAIGLGREWLGLADAPADTAEATRSAASFFAFTDTTLWTPLCEELAFRGLLYTALRTRLGIGPSSVATAAAFALMHQPDTVGLAAYFFFPAVLSSLWYERTRSLWPSIIDHALTNLTVTLLLAGPTP